VKLHTLTRFLFGDHKRSPWMRDVARSGPEWLVDKLALVTGVPREDIVETTYDGYIGKVFSAKQSCGQLKWLLPPKSRSSNRRGYSIQYCPSCLSGDAQPYFRRKWRLGFCTFCPSHRNMLLDCCPKCGLPVVFHRRDFGVPVNQAGSITQCYKCGFEMRRASRCAPEVYSDELYLFYSDILTSIDEIRRGKVYGLDFFAVLHQLCKLMVMNQNKGRLREFVIHNLGVKGRELPFGRYPLEQRRVEDRYFMVSMALWLLQKPEERLKGAWIAGAVRYNQYLKDFADPPRWYKCVVSKFNRLKK